MLTTTARFDRVLRAAHVVSIGASLYPADGSDPLDLFIVSGSVTLDRTAAQRGRATLQTLRTPQAPAAFGDEIHLTRGLGFSSGGTENVPLGVYRVEEVNDGALSAELSVTLGDRSGQVTDSVPVSPVTFPAGTVTETAIETLVLRTYPGLTTHLPGDAHTLPQPTVVTDNPWQSILDMAASIGCEAFFDAAGEFVLQAIPDASSATSVWRIDAGIGGVLVDATRRTTRGSVKNGVRIVGEQLGKHAPVSALVHDDDPTSPTYWLGPFGKVPEVQTAQHVGNATHAGVMAAARLRDLLGTAKTVTLSSVPVPQLEPGDCITVVYPDASEELHIIDQVGIPLTVTDQMSLVTRSQPA